jgi:hypothetical protein
MKEQGPQQDFLFGKINYKILLIGIVIALGFILMSGGK